MTTIASNLQAVRNAIAAAAAGVGRPPDDIVLLAVCKTFSPEAIREAYHAGQAAFGESYVQEALEKIVSLHDLPIEWHFIGPIQSNKTRAIAENFSWVHSIDRLKIAERLSAQRPTGVPPLQVCLEPVALGGRERPIDPGGEKADELRTRHDDLAPAGLPGRAATSRGHGPNGTSRFQGRCRARWRPPDNRALRRL